MTRFRIIVAAVCAAAVVLAGCEATDSFAHDPEKAKTRRGRGIRRGCRRGRGTADRRQQSVQVGDDRRGRGRAGRRRSRELHGQAGSEAAPADGRHRRRCRPQRRSHHARHAGQRDVRLRQRRSECAVLPGARQGRGHAQGIRQDRHRGRGTHRQRRQRHLQPGPVTAPRHERRVLSVEPRRHGHARGDDRRGRSASGGVERYRGRARPEPARRDHDRPGDPRSRRARRSRADSDAADPGRRIRGGLDSYQAASGAASFRSFRIAFASIWRIRSAETPYSAASSCSVALDSPIQRARRIAWLRASSCLIASATRSLVSSSHSSRSTATAGSASGAGR